MIAQTALAQLRVGQWNITNWRAVDVDGDATAMPPIPARGPAFRTALYGAAPSGLQFAPDVLIVEEITEGSGSGQTNLDALVGVLNSAPGSPGDWAAAPYVANQGDTGNALLYRTSKIQWISTITLGTQGVDVCQCSDTNKSPRDNQRWRVRLVGYSGPGAELYIYGAHMKAGSTPDDQARRVPEAKRIRDDANDLPAGIGGVILGGDFNVQNSGQTFYQYLIGYDSLFPVGDPRRMQGGQFFDPINRAGVPATSTTSATIVTWENSSTYRNIHTQEPSSQMDSRHDQILIGASLRDGQGMSYIPYSSSGNILAQFVPAGGTTAWFDDNHSYRCWGNDGNNYGTNIMNSGNAMVGGTIASALITTVSGNGHLPVYLDLQVPARLGSPAGTIDFGTVTQNSVAQQTIQISNAANVALYSKGNNGWGIDPLTYSLSASGPFAAPPGTFTRTATAAPAATNSHTITLDTTVPGLRTGTLTISSDDPDVPVRVINLVAQVGPAGPPPPPAGNYDVNGDGVISIEDLHSWYGLFTDVNGSGSVDISDLTALRNYLRWYETQDVTHGRR